MQPIPPLGPGDSLKRHLEHMRTVANKSTELNGDKFIGVHEWGTGRHLVFNYLRLIEYLRDDLGLFRAFKIVKAEQDDTNRRYTYTANLAVKRTKGHGGWEVNANDIDSSGAQETYELFNILEDQNGPSGTF